ncbi:MAG: helix-turn-helix domain-containing protein, partial [Zoogloeaceae bacterium]|nr:helix-turn-helix domain-containing protein [Zoogloeaceae bacterium]
MRSYTQLTQAERYQIEALHGAGQSQTAIAAQLNRSQSTISRELLRNGQKRGY